MQNETPAVRGDALETGIREAKQKIEELKALRSRQEEELSALRAQSEQTARKLENRPEPDALSGDNEDVLASEPTFGYGARMIGRTVLEAAQYCNRLTGDGSDPSAKELVNLILGKTEVIKAEMLEVILSEQTPEEKKTAIDAKFEQAKDYFESVIHQTK